MYFQSLFNQSAMNERKHYLLNAYVLMALILPSNGNESFVLGLKIFETMYVMFLGLLSIIHFKNLFQNPKASDL